MRRVANYKKARAGQPPERPAKATAAPTVPDAAPDDRTPQRARTTRPAVDPLLVNRKTAAAILGIGCTTLDGLVRDGTLPTVRLRGRVLFGVETLRAIARGEGGRE